MKYFVEVFGPQQDNTAPLVHQSGIHVVAGFLAFAIDHDIWKAGTKH